MVSILISHIAFYPNLEGVESYLSVIIPCKLYAKQAVKDGDII